MVVAHRGGIGTRMITRFATLSVPMPYALPVAHGLRQRDLAFVEANGCVAEISPLPGLHQESLAEALDDLAAGTLRTPSARFADSVLRAQLQCDIWTQRDSKRTLPAMNSLVVDEDTKLDEHSVIKVKIGREPSRDLPRLLSILERSPDCRLRLDGNRLLSLDQVLEVVSCLPQDRIEYVEEPLVDPARLPELAKVVPVALDESLHDPAASRHEDEAGAWVHVMKPTRLGSLEELADEITCARNLQRDVVLTSCFESPWTLGVLCRVAQEYGLSRAQGLGTSNLYQDWPRINMASSLQDVELPELDWQPWI